MADVAGAHALQGVELQCLYPRLVDVANEQVAYHLGMGEQRLAAVVVVGRRSLG